MICPKCKKNIRDTSKFCGYCGNQFVKETKTFISAPVKPVSQNYTAQSLRQPERNLPKCPKCGSTALQAGTKGVSVGKAAAGALIAGPIGLLAGGIGMNNTRIICLNCGHKFEPQA